jgi:hypothetical protein
MTDPGLLRYKLERMRDELHQQLVAADHIEPGLLATLAHIALVLPGLVEGDRVARARERQDHQNAERQREEERRLAEGRAPDSGW